jgi:hypothetical protein
VYFPNVLTYSKYRQEVLVVFVRTFMKDWRRYAKEWQIANKFFWGGGSTYRRSDGHDFLGYKCQNHIHNGDLMGIKRLLLF